MHKSSKQGSLRDFFLRGDKTLAQLTLFVIGGLPFVLILIFVLFHLPASTKMILLASSWMGFFAGLAALLQLVRNKEADWRLFAIVSGILGLFLAWVASFFALYLFFAM
jgi:hypothetical protein